MGGDFRERGMERQSFTYTDEDFVRNFQEERFIKWN
jgi:hypothetical protein